MSVASTGSVVVCTRDRLWFLQHCLANLDHQISEPNAFEIVVVDNGSTDRTRRFLSEWATAAPQHRRVVEEPIAGLSRARNAGADAARHPVVLFLDDDAIAPAGWVAAHLRAYDRDPSVDGVGGPVVLTWPAGRPAWATERLDHWFSALDLGDECRPFPPPHGPYGTNMSIRRRRLLELGGFPQSLGRTERSLLSGEDAALWARLWGRGGRVRYEPAALVVHQVVPSRITRRWIVRRALAQGRTNARLLVLDDRPAIGSVVKACHGDARLAWQCMREAAGAAMREDVVSSDALDELARAAGHASAVAEHLLLWMFDALRVDWR